MSLPTWVSPEETKPAPMPLLLVQAFVNTWDGDRGSDLLADPASAAGWLAEAGIGSGPGAPDPAELYTARNAREGIRALLEANNGGPHPAPRDLEPLQAIARAYRPELHIASDGQVSLGAESGDRHDAQLLKLLLIIRDAQREGTWPRLKACRNPECRWAFYDRSHSRRGTWCDMATCGNRLKNRRLRERQS